MEPGEGSGAKRKFFFAYGYGEAVVFAGVIRLKHETDVDEYMEGMIRPGKTGSMNKWAVCCLKNDNQ